MRRQAGLLAVFLLALSAFFPPASAQAITSSVSLKVYDDGTVAVTQVLAVPANDTSVDLTLLSTVIANPLAVDQSGASLYFQIVGANITVYTVGATGITVSYDTAALTGKEGTVWTLSFHALFNTTVDLPQGSTLTSVSGTPYSISAAGGSPMVVVPPGSWTIDYGLPIQAVSTSTSSSTSSSTSGPLSSASSSTISSSGSESSTSTSAQGAPQSRSSSGSSSQGSGSGQSSQSSPGNQPATGEFGVLPYLLVAAVVVAAGGFLFVRRRRGAAPGPETSELRPDDVKVIDFISEKGGKVLEPEIRMRFALPKTSAWRQIKRLERLGYVKVTKIGSQNQVELVKGRQGGDSG